MSQMKQIFGARNICFISIIERRKKVKKINLRFLEKFLNSVER